MANNKFLFSYIDTPAVILSSLNRATHFLSVITYQNNGTKSSIKTRKLGEKKKYYNLLQCLCKIESSSAVIKFSARQMPKNIVLPRNV